MNKMYREPDELIHAKTMLTQLEHAVQRFNGKTTITESDTRLIGWLIRNLERYDRMASAAYWLASK